MLSISRSVERSIPSCRISQPGKDCGFKEEDLEEVEKQQHK